MTRIVWTSQSITDLESIRLYIAQDAPRVAEIYVDRLLHATDRLAAFPFSGEVVPELGKEAIRQVLHGSYRLIYRVRKSIVEILTVWHGARLLDPSMLQDPPEAGES
jgi:plasmid stabilization system protein ParE